MPTFYDSEPILKTAFTLQKEDFGEAYYLNKNCRTFFSRHEVKTGLCFTCAMIIAAFTPHYTRVYASAWVPIAAIILAVFGMGYFFTVQPQRQKKRGELLFDSNRLLSKENSCLIYRDSLVYENEYEKYTHFWTDFERCTENDRLIVLSGGERALLVIKKENLSPEKKAMLSNHLSETFAVKYRKAKS